MKWMKVFQLILLALPSLSTLKCSKSWAVNSLYTHGTSLYTSIIEDYESIKLFKNESFDKSHIEFYANVKGITLNYNIVGPTLRLEAYSKAELLGYLTAFIRPFPIGTLHLDTIQVKNRRQALGFRRNGWSIDGSSISFIMGSWALCWAREWSCHRAELLAVKDNDRMHQVLIKLYQSFGFKSVRDVGDDMQSISDRIVWGAVGTLMSLEFSEFFKTWTPKLNYMVRLEDQKGINT